MRTARQRQSVTEGVTGERQTKREFWAALTPAEREGLAEMAESMGPLEFVAAWTTTGGRDGDEGEIRDE